MNITDVCAVILAGGQSRRMGFNKALVDIGGLSLIQMVINRILPVTDQILISSNDCDSYKFLNYPIVTDFYEGRGPLAGFHAAMQQKICSLYIILACDLPNLQTSFLRNLIAYAEGFDAVIPRSQDGLVHPLCAVYRRTCFPSVEKALERGASKVIETFLDDSLSIKWVSPDEGPYQEADLANINTPEDLQQFRASIDPGAAKNSICSSQPSKDPDIL